MKTLIIAFFALSALINLEKQEEIFVITATFDRYEDEIYYFTDENKASIEFTEIEESVRAKYDLTGPDFEGDNFKVSYRIDMEEDEDGETEVFKTIVDLELLK
jgi:hypothetical protein